MSLSATLLACGGSASSPAPVTPTPDQRETPPPPTDMDSPPAGQDRGMLEPSPPAPPSALDTVQAGAFDNGKMWTFDAPPKDYLRETYDFAPDDQWFESARLGALRIPNCSASFVSPHGLVMTNHHCGREFVTQVTVEGEDLLDRGFYASSLDEERPVEDFEADQLIDIIDVTSEVRDAVGAVDEAAARGEVRDSVTEAIAERIQAERGGEEAGVQVEVVSLYHGGLYSAYVFRRYERVKLVMAPELQLGYFGGDPDNFTYPRYSLDMTFFRVYGDDGRPLDTEHYFPWSDRGAMADELVFIIGNPGSTSRLQTVSELEFRRDVETPALLSFINSRIEAIQGYLEGREGEVGIDEVRNSLFSLLNSQKAFTGMLKGLRDPYVIARRRAAENEFRKTLQDDPELSDRYLHLFAEMAELQARKATIQQEFEAFAGFGSPDYESSLIQRTLAVFQYMIGMQQGAGQEELDGFVEQLRGVENRPLELDEHLLRARFEDMERAFGAEDPTVRAMLQGRTADGAAASLLANSLMADSARAEDALLGGTLDPSTEPAFQFIQNMLGRFGPFQGLLSTVLPQEEEIQADLGRAHFEVDGTTVPPDATFSLRLADGVITAYPYNGTVAPTHTTFHGMYDRHYSNPGSEEWALPERWQEPPESFDLSAPLNFVSTADIIGGNSGSPVVNRELQIVGLVFDGNIESLPGDYIYMPELNRSVAVDSRGIIEALDDIYDADRIVLELTTGTLAATEEEADRRR